MVVINTEKIIAGIFLFLVAYTLLLALDPAMNAIIAQAVFFNIDTGFLVTMKTLGDWFCFLVGAAGILYIATSPLGVDTTIVEM